MKTIFFLRSAPYDYSVPGMSLYQSFDVVAKKEYDPELLPGGEQYLRSIVPQEVFASDKVFTSPELRCQQTGQFVSPQSTTLSLLREIGYTMEDLLSEDAFFTRGKPNVTRARQAFVSALIENRLEEPYKALVSRTRELLSFLASAKEEQISCISHGFYLKFLEAYIREPLIANKPELVRKYFDGSKETFTFCEGFSLAVKNHKYFIKTEIKKVSNFV